MTKNTQRQKYIDLVMKAINDPIANLLSKQEYLDALEELASNIECSIDCINDELRNEQKDSEYNK